MLTDFYNYLAVDATLRGLISGATAQLPRIYPEIAPEDTAAPYLIYGPAHEGSLDETLDQMTIQISVFVNENEQATADAIIRRLKAMLDLQDGIQGLISSTDYYIYWCKHVGGVSEILLELHQVIRPCGGTSV